MKRFSRRERVALAGGMVAASLVPLNSTLIAVGLPDIARDLDVTTGRTALLVTTYLVAMALLQPFAGRLGDRFGTRNVVIAGLAGFGVASLAAAAAPSFTVLVGLRVLQAVAGSSLIPNVMSLLRAEVAPDHRGRAFGILGAGIGAGAAVGPVLGGVVVQLGGWRGIFVVSVPVVLVGLPLVGRLRVESTAPDEERTPMRRLLRQPAFLAACAVQASSNYAQYTLLLVIPVVLAARAWSSGATGLVLSGMTIGLLILSPVGGSLGDRTDRRLPVRAGTGLGVLAALAVAAIGLDVTGVLVVGVAGFGVGMGLASASLQTAALEAVSATSAGSAAGVMSTSRYVGSISSTTVIALLVGDGTDGVASVLWLAALGAALAFAASHRIARGDQTSMQSPSTAAATGTVPPE